MKCPGGVQYPFMTLLDGDTSEMSLTSRLARFAAQQKVEWNKAEIAQIKASMPSRGTLILDYLLDKHEAYEDKLMANYKRYAGFNLIFGGLNQ